MKIFSIASMAVLLLGATATMHTTTVKAEIDGCYQLEVECDQGNQEACHLYQVGGCKGRAPQVSITAGTPAAKKNEN